MSADFDEALVSTEIYRIVVENWNHQASPKITMIEDIFQNELEILCRVAPLFYL